MNKSEILISAGIDYNAALQRFGNKEALYFKYLFRLPQEPVFESYYGAFITSDYTAAINGAHTLKGIAANLSITNLSLLCQGFISALREGRYDDANTAFVKLNDCYESVCKVIEQVKNM